MSFITERLAAITAMLNSIITNAKKIDELPIQATLIEDSKIHVSNAGNSESLTVKKIIDNSKEYSDSLIIALKGGVGTTGDTLQKLYNLILGGTSEVVVANITERNAYNIPHLPFQVFVIDDGDGKWAKYQATTTGTNAAYVKLSDPDLLNAALNDILFGAFVNSLTAKSTLANNDLFNITDSADSNKQKKVLFSVLKSMVLENPIFTGLISGNGGTKTTAGVGILDLIQTWNNAGAVFTAIKMNITDTASGSASLLIDFQVSGVSKFSVDKAGNVSFAGIIKQDIFQPNGSSRGVIVRANGQNMTAGMSYNLRLDNAANGNIIINTSLNFNSLDMTYTGFQVSSGAADFNYINCGSIINQTGSATGIVRGFYFNPTIISSTSPVRALDIQQGKLEFSSTITPVGTTGAQTINKISGKVNAAAGTTSLVVTNNLVTTSSIVMVQVGTNDATCKSAIAVEANGSFTIYYVAPTAETVIKFKVIN